MDLAVYISELINEHGTLNVPGLGMFKRVRKGSYYDTNTGLFYPPHYQLILEQISVTNDDTVLIQYISKKNRVSLGSSRYFLDKYLSGILQQAQLDDAPFGQLGWLYREQDELRFKPNMNSTVMNAVNFGFTPVQVNQSSKQNQQSSQSVVQDAVAEPKVTVVKELVPPVLPVTSQPETVQNNNPQIIPSAEPLNLSQTKIDEDETAALPHNDAEIVKTAQPLNVWIVSLITVAVIVLSFFAYYKYNETSDKELVEKQEKAPTNEAAATAPESADTVVINNAAPAPADTVSAKNTVVTGIPVKAKTPEASSSNSTLKLAVNTVYDPQKHKFALMGGAYGNLEQASMAIDAYASRGIPAVIFENVPNRTVKIALGYFKTYKEGQAAKLALVKLKNLKSGDLYVNPIKVKKKK